MAIAAGTIWEMNASGGSINNGSAFNPTNANFLTDLTATSATGNSPVVASASYNFVAGDVGAWVYIKSGTNWTPGWYQIASVAANQATLTATIGTAIQTTTGAGYPTPRYGTNTVAGVATTGSPTAGTFGIDYSQGTSSITNNTDLALVTNTTCTSAGSPFGVNHIGNFIRISAGTGYTTGWYEIVSVTVVTATLDRSPGTAVLSGGTFRVGGAYPMNGANEDAYFENGVAGNVFFSKQGSYTLNSGFSTAASGGVQNPIIWAGYAVTRGDNPTGSTRPTINLAGFSNQAGNNWDLYGLIMTGTGTNALILGNNGKIFACKLTNTSTTAGRVALAAPLNFLYKCEAISYRGRAVSFTSGFCYAKGCYFHDSDTGLLISSGSGFALTDCIISSNVTFAVRISVANTQGCAIDSCTLLGSATTKTGNGVDIVTGVNNVRILDTIITGFVTGVNHADNQFVGFDDSNDYQNNTTDVTNWQKGATDSTLAPGFINVAEIRFTNGTTSGSVLTSSGANFSTVTDNVDFLYLVSGTGVATGQYLITSHTTTTLTLDSATGNNATADKVGQITTGHNFGIGPNLKALGYPGVFPAGLTTGFTDIGAAQRQDPGGGSFTFVG